MPLRGSQRKGPWLTLQCGVYNWIARNDASLRKPLDKRLGVLKVRILPSGTVQPERATRSIGQGHISLVAETSRQEPWHEGAQFEAYAEPLTLGRTVDRGCLRLWSPQGEKGFASVSRYGHLKMTRRNGEKLSTTLTLTTPDLFDKSRV
jgi:hypothetical protein